MVNGKENVSLIFSKENIFFFVEPDIICPWFHVLLLWVTFCICSTHMKVKKIFVLSTGHLAGQATITPQVYVFDRLI